MEILKVKNLSLDFDVTGEVAGGYRYTGVECGLKSVPVVGLKKRSGILKYDHDPEGRA